MPTWIERWLNWMVRRGSFKLVQRKPTPASEPAPYIGRWYLIRLPEWLRRPLDLPEELLLHRFFMSDPDPLHNHPWDWGRLILSLGYYEQRFLTWRWNHKKDTDHHERYQVRTPAGWQSFVWRESYETPHRVQLFTTASGEERPVWTLFWHWPRTNPKNWVFYDEVDGMLIPRAARPEDDESKRGQRVGHIFPRRTTEGRA